MSNLERIAKAKKAMDDLERLQSAMDQYGQGDDSVLDELSDEDRTLVLAIFSEEGRQLLGQLSTPSDSFEP